MGRYNDEFAVRMPISPTTWAGWFAALAAFYGLLVLYGYWDTYHPTRYPDGPWQQQSQLGAEDVWFASADGTKLHGWWTPIATEHTHVLLFLHGNAGNVSHRIDHIPAMRAAGTPVFVPDYRGFGRSEGSPSESGVYADAGAAYDWLLTQGYSANQIILYGQSLGTAVATDLASRRECAGLVLESPFPSKKAVAQTVVPYLGPLAVWGMNTAEKLAQVHVPVFVLHGDQDQVIRFHLGEEVFAAANEPKQFWRVPGAGHPNIVETAGPEYTQRLKAFYNSLPKAP